MSENAIIVENLSKRYLIGHRFAARGQYKYTALRDVFGRGIRNFARKASDVVRGARWCREMRLRSSGRSKM